MMVFRTISGIFKKFSHLSEVESIHLSHPLYRLAPSTDLGVRQLRLQSLIEQGPKRDNVCNIVHFPRHNGFFKYIITFLGLTPRKEKVALQVAKIGNSYLVEKGLTKLKLAILLRQERIAVRIIQYDYFALKIRMGLEKCSKTDVVRLACKNGRGYDYYMITPAQVEVLINRHRVPSDAPGMAAAQRAAGLENRENCASLGEGTAKRSGKLYLVKK